MNLDQAIAKVREVSLGLREPQDGANLEHQAKKLEHVAVTLEVLRNRLLELFDGPDATTEVHGGGTGNE